MPNKSMLSEIEGSAHEGESSAKQQGPALSFVADMYDAVAMVIERVVILDRRYEEIQEKVFVTGADIKQLAQKSRAGEIFYICDLSSIKPISLRYVDINFVIAYSSIIVVRGEIFLVKMKGKQQSDVQSINFDFKEIERGGIADLIADNASTGGDIK